VNGAPIFGLFTDVNDNDSNNKLEQQQQQQQKSEWTELAPIAHKDKFFDICFGHVSNNGIYHRKYLMIFFIDIKNIIFIIIFIIIIIIIIIVIIVVCVVKCVIYFIKKFY
jgi:type IV secretory pathway TrbL component